MAGDSLTSEPAKQVNLAQTHPRLIGAALEAASKEFKDVAKPDPAKCTDSSQAEHEARAQLQIRLLACARAVFQMSRITMGPLVVAMATEYGYTSEEKGQILSAFAGGYALTQVVGGLAADRYGGAPVLTFGVATSGICGLLVPFAADMGVWYLWWLLWFMGLTQGPTYPAQLVTTARWATGSLRSYASALGGVGSTAGSLLALGVTPVLAERAGWRITSLAFGFATLAFGVAWHRLGRSQPESGDPAAAAAAVAAAAKATENAAADDASGFNMLRHRLSVLLALPVLAVFGAHSVHNFVRYFLMAWMPTYYREVFTVSADAAALMLMLPELIGLAVGLLSANLGRHLQESRGFTALTCRRLFATVAFTGGAVGLALISLAPTPLLATLAICIVQGVMTLQGLGWGANYLEISRHHSGLVTGVGNTVATGASFCAPLFASWLLAQGGGAAAASAPSAQAGAEAWPRLFLAFASANVVGLAIFLPLCSTTPVDLRADEVEAEQRKAKVA
eukprot:TRINITY_DN58607_c0_g1_i1.p1 TRINITY_DN58607_c0_g1~~TRINITY_DN58607_c0_g1_i1.p1  ORF type:complete len:528 (-),score=118.31 TRINITY_DN58607_c0_g1_i1:108-1631(-)